MLFEGMSGRDGVFAYGTRIDRRLRMKTFLTTLIVGLLVMNSPGMGEASIGSGSLNDLSLSSFLGDFVVKFANWGF